MRALSAFVAAIAIAWAAPAAAQTAPPVAHPLTHEDLEAYFDGFFPDALARAEIAGAVVVVVKDGHVLLEKGYGYSDVATHAPVDPARTLFRPGSISKLFTWTAVMQLVEQGKLNLDRDVNDYLDFKIPDAFGKPVTLRNLMTHTPGFEEHIKGLMVDDPRLFYALRDAVAGTTPARIYPPGEVPAYSNYGAALAGYIVQRVSGERFEDYVARHIFAPLKMDHSTFEQPLPPRLAPDMSKGYFLPRDKPQPFEFISFSPAGGLSATGEDIAHFMIAHLNGGAYDGASILKPETAALMHRAAFSPTPPLPAMALGFYHEDANGLSIIGHGGDSQVFHSDLHLILDRNVGLYVSLNSAGHETSPIAGLRPFLLAHFLDRYFPAAPPPKAKPFAAVPGDAMKIAGAYELSRRSQTNFMSVSSLTLPIVVVPAKDGSIGFPGLAAVGLAPKWVEIAPFVWREQTGTHRFVARLENGRVKWLSSDLFPPIMVLQRVPFWRSPMLLLPAVGASFVMLALTVLFWPVKAVLRWRYGQKFGRRGRELVLYRLTRVAALLYVVAFGGWAWFLLAGQMRLSVFDSPSDGLIRLLQLVSLAAVAGTLVSILEFVTALRDRERPWWTKATDGLIVLASLVLASFLIGYNFFTLSLNY